MSSVDYSAVILAVLLSTSGSPYAVKYAVELDKANIIKREDRASIVRMDDVEEGLPSAFALGPGGERPSSCIACTTSAWWRFRADGVCTTPSSKP